MELLNDEITVMIIKYAAIASFVTYGILQCILAITAKEFIHRAWGLSITFLMGIVMGFLLPLELAIWQRFVWGAIIGCVSIGLYKSAIKSLLEVIPAIMDKILGVKK